MFYAFTDYVYVGLPLIKYERHSWNQHMMANLAVADDCLR